MGKNSEKLNTNNGNTLKKNNGTVQSKASNSFNIAQSPRLSKTGKETHGNPYPDFIPPPTKKTKEK